MKNTTNSGRSRKGTVTVEFALVAPVLVFLVIGVIELGRGLMVKEVLSDAARKGCRTGVLGTGTNSTITADINQVLSDNNINSSAASITILVNGNAIDAGTAKAYDKISVTVSIPVSQITWVTPLFLPGSYIESDSVVMMRQQ